jgi:hypothetical protein
MDVSTCGNALNGTMHDAALALTLYLHYVAVKQIGGSRRTETFRGIPQEILRVGPSAICCSGPIAMPTV